MRDAVEKAIVALLEHCKRNNWSGFDPYDALNSRFFAALPFVQNRIGRLIFTQAMKRSPVNLRPFLLVPREQNPKALALFISALIRLQDLNLLNGSTLITSLMNRLIDLRTSDKPYFCWGYNFDWQSRQFFTLKFEPNIICTAFAANAFLDAFDKYSNPEYLNIAVSAGRFLLSGLNISKEDNGLCFSYTPLDWGKVHNANLLGAALLSRIYKATGEQVFLDFSHRAVNYSITKQNSDGSWPYGESKTQQWIDNFHTGYNLVALKKFSEYTGNTDFVKNFRKGFQFYKENLFTANGLPKYYHNQKYPIDIHSIAQSIITLVEFKTFDEDNIYLARRIFTWTLKTMQSKNGYFFYQKKRFFKNRIPYMRWSQAWMLYALAILAQALRDMNDLSYLSKK